MKTMWETFNDLRKELKTPGFCDGPVRSEEVAFGIATRQPVSQTDHDLLKLTLEQTQERLRQAEEAIAKREATALRVAQCAGEFARDAARGQPVSALTDEQRATIEEAAQVMESAAKHNTLQCRTVFAHGQQDRAVRPRALLAASPKVAVVEPDEFGQKVTHLIGDLVKAKSQAWRDSLVEQLIELIEPSLVSHAPPVEPVSDDKRDAERWRKLRSHRETLLLTGFFGNGCINRTLTEVDAAIDALAPTPPQPQKKKP